MSDMSVWEFIENFVKDSLGNKKVVGGWRVEEEVGHESVKSLVFYPTEDDEPTGEKEVFAYRLADKSVLFNANVLQHIGSRMAWGHARHRWGEIEHQRVAQRAGAIPLPFTLFSETGLKVYDFQWIAKPIAEELSVVSLWNGRPSSQHFSGACVFSIGENVFLFDIDRQEITHGIFNAFVVKLPKAVSSVEEAYNVLMPDFVHEAVSAGKDVKRQGEFFFVKYSDECPVKVELTDEEKQILRFIPSRVGFGIPQGSMSYYDTELFRGDEPLDTPEKRLFQEAAAKYRDVRRKYDNATPSSGTIGKSNSGSHTVEKYVKSPEGIAFASGKISQSRRQHHDLTLEGWYMIVPNTAVTSWTISGAID